MTCLAALGAGVALAILTVGGAGAGEDVVYDPGLDATVPVELQNALNASEASVSAAGEDDAVAVPAPDDPQPAAYGSSIASVGAGEAVDSLPFPSGTIDATTAWEVGYGNASQFVYAGATTGNSSEGLIIDVLYNYDSPNEDVTYVTASGIGSIRLIAYDALCRKLTFEAGEFNPQDGYYDLATKTIQMGYYAVGGCNGT